ncbi:hypothetical protein SDC9_175536 [bioreactor metagenome]|uniref:Uncharacterized protein n=1 Tax=bioreactor metagenome TaxID=1076179 RepID=A0A645GMJ5_9ZZZZ
MIDGAAAGTAPGQITVITFHLRQVAFLISILILPDDHRMVILPEIKDNRLRLMMLKQAFFSGQVFIRVNTGAFNIVSCFKHDLSSFLYSYHIID